MPPESTLVSLKEELGAAWSDIRKLIPESIADLLPFGAKAEPSAWERLARHELARVKEENAFFQHLAAWAPGCTLIAATNLLFELGMVDISVSLFGERFWCLVPIGAWTLGLFIHGLDTFYGKSLPYRRERDRLLETLAASPDDEAPPEDPDLGELRDRIVAVADETRQAVRTRDPEAVPLVSRGEVGALSAVAWLDAVRHNTTDETRNRTLRREVARSLATPLPASTRQELEALTQLLDRREQLAVKLELAGSEQRSRLDSFLIALQNARLAQGNALERLRAPLGERVQLLEAGATPAATDPTRRINEEIRMAQDLQQSILPSAAPDVPGLTVAHLYRPCNEVGGDFYDFHRTDDGRLRIALGDASGHGLDSSMVSSMAKSALYLQMKGEKDLAESLGELNQMMCDTLGRRRLMTMALLQIDPAAARLDWVNAGQIYPLYKRGERIEELVLPGYPLGVRRQTDYRLQTASLEPGDLLILLTDGVLEATRSDGEPFGWDRLREVLAADDAKDPHATLEAIAGAVSRHLGTTPPQDDVTMIAVRFQP